MTRRRFAHLHPERGVGESIEHRRLITSRSCACFRQLAGLFFDVCPWSRYWSTLSPRLFRLDATVEFLLALLWRHREV